MKPGLNTGATHTVHRLIEQELTVPHILPGTLLERGETVLASGYLVALLETACWQVVHPHLDPHESAVGVEFALTHCAPAWPGDLVEITVTCTQISHETRDVEWHTSATNLRTRKVIGRMRHRLRVVDSHRFQEHTMRPRPDAPNSGPRQPES
ncbi:hotdog domain-containing protein [Saccharopolyspora shandongensis]|uniref:thioesterase family protein n=1 Tax=Saccharopolyspora shandongensis TaxID=418495 RepID=UPI00341D0487